MAEPAGSDDDTGVIPVTLMALAATRHRTTGDTIAGAFAFVVTAVIVVGLIVYLARWKRVRGATSRADAMQRAFGDKGAQRIVIGCFVVAAIFLVLVVVIKTSGG
jgi:Na+/proline symporter